jgi:hypothetical protein
MGDPDRQDHADIDRVECMVDEGAVAKQGAPSAKAFDQ